MRRILVVHSTSDPAVDDRISAMAKRPELAEYELHHATFIRPEDEAELSQVKPSEFLRRNELRILSRLDRQIQSTKSDLIILHSGIAFSIAPEAILSIFSELKTKHPQLKFGIQQNVIFDDMLVRFPSQIEKIFDRSPEITDLVKVMF
jgi:hypothetical protein